MRRFVLCFLFLAGCAVPKKTLDTTSVSQKPSQTSQPTPTPTPSAAIPTSHAERDMILFVPQSDDGVSTWLKWFTKYPGLRMVIAMSPRFLRMTKEPLLKQQMLSLMKSGRLELGLQIPNAPVLPLLVDTNSAKEALPPQATLPSPPYAYPDDVIQIVAQSKSDFFHQWNTLPRGLILPFGAISPQLLSLLQRLGFSWIAAAAGLPEADGPFQAGSLLLWDGAPQGNPVGTVVHVWDERLTKDNPLDAWVKDIKAKQAGFILPSDSGLAIQTLGSQSPREETWVSTATWSLWIGDPDKNAGWDSLRKTREALESYKNSGRASVQRLDLAFNEIYSAQNSNYFLSMGSTTVSPGTAEERQHEFQATLGSVYRLIGQSPPEDLFQSSAQAPVATVHASSTTTRAEALPDGSEHVQLDDAIGDSLLGTAGPDISSLDVWSSSSDVRWSVTLASGTANVIDIYVDMNGQPNAGTSALLPGRKFVTSPVDAWEFAITIKGPIAALYRTQGSGSYAIIQTFPVIAVGQSYRVTIPRDFMRGSPKRWGYQVLAWVQDPANPAKLSLSDLIDPFEVSQQDLWADLSAGNRNDIPFVRIKQR